MDQLGKVHSHFFAITADGTSPDIIAVGMAAHRSYKGLHQALGPEWEVPGLYMFFAHHNGASIPLYVGYHLKNVRIQFRGLTVSGAVVPFFRKYYRQFKDPYNLKLELAVVSLPGIWPALIERALSRNFNFIIDNSDTVEDEEEIQSAEVLFTEACRKEQAIKGSMEIIRTKKEEVRQSQNCILLQPLTRDFCFAVEGFGLFYTRSGL